MSLYRATTTRQIEMFACVKAENETEAREEAEKLFSQAEIETDNEVLIEQLETETTIEIKQTR